MRKALRAASTVMSITPSSWAVLVKMTLPNVVRSGSILSACFSQVGKGLGRQRNFYLNSVQEDPVQGIQVVHASASVSFRGWKRQYGSSAR
jgi:hypothetical protein